MPMQGGALRRIAREGVCSGARFLELGAVMLAQEREMQAESGD